MERFILTRNEDGLYIVADLLYHTEVRFKEHHFNDSQEAVAPTGISATNAAKSMREIGEWLHKEHKDIVF